MNIITRNRNKQAGFTLFEVAWLISFLLSVAIFIVLCYVAYHFIAKYW